MEIKVNSSELLKRLEQLAKVAESKSPIPILSDFLVETKGNVLLITASDSEVWLSMKCSLASSCQGVKFCVNARDFLGLVKNVSGRDLSIYLEDGNTMTCDYGNGNFSMPYDNAEEFPLSSSTANDAESIILDGKKVLKAIELTKYAVGNSVTQPIMNGIHFEFSESGMVVSSTDTHKVAIYKDFSVHASTENGFTMPKKSSAILSSILNSIEGDVKISFSANSISVNNTEFKMTSRLIEGVYLNCQSVVPKSCPIVITADKNAFVQALRRVLPMSNEMSNLVVLFFEQGQVTITADDQMFGKSASETVSCDCDSELKIGFKGSDLIDTIRNIEDDNIVIELTSKKLAGVFYTSSSYTKEEYVSVLAPSSI